MFEDKYVPADFYNQWKVRRATWLAQQFASILNTRQDKWFSFRSIYPDQEDDCWEVKYSESYNSPSKTYRFSTKRLEEVVAHVYGR